MKRFLIYFSLAILFAGNQKSIAQTITAVVEDKTKKIVVSGSAEMKVIPDEIFVSFTLQEYYNKQKTKIDIDQIQKDFLEKCAKAGINKERIQIQNMSGFDQSSWYWRKRKKEVPDMMASTTYVIKFSQASEIDKLVNTLDENATQSMNIFKTSHSNIETYRKEIKIKALQAAKAKAQYLCESIGEKIGKTIYIEEVNNEYPQPMYKMGVMSMAADESMSANQGIDFQEMTIRYSINASFEIQ